MGRRQVIQTPGGSLSFRQARPAEASQCRLNAVDAGIATVQGGCLIYGNGIEIRQTGEAQTIAVLVGPFASWWLIETHGANVFDYVFTRPGYVALKFTGGGQPSGILPMTAVPLLELGSSRALNVVNEEPQCGSAIAAEQSAQQWPRVRSAMGVPLCQLGTYTKDSTTQLAAGYTQGVAGLSTPVYVNLTYQSPFVGSMAGQLCTPMYFYFALVSATAVGLVNPRVRMGDIACLQTPISLTIIVNHAVAEVGLYVPDDELEAEAGSGVYSWVDMAVYALGAAKTQAANGDPADVPFGVMRPNLPGTGYAYHEVRTV
jgi:hypothetical protein